MNTVQIENKFIGEIIRESLKDPSVLEGFKSFLVKSREVTVENFEPSHWHVERFEMSLAWLDNLIPLLQNNFSKNQWYIHFYSEKTNEMFVILPGKTFKISKFKDASWEKMITYGERVGVGRRWTENIPVDFEI